MSHDDENLLPGFYYYAGLQIEVKFFSTYSAFLKGYIEYWDWLVYDGFGKGMLNSGVERTREDAIAVASTNKTVRAISIGNRTRKIALGQQSYRCGRQESYISQCSNSKYAIRSRVCSTTSGLEKGRHQRL